jgi:branched-chain amino acid aminotransferase
MAANKIRYLWQSGGIVPIENAQVHLLTPTVFWGTNVFEGLRGYWNSEKEQMYCFREKEHFQRLAESVKMMRMSLPFDPEKYGDYVKDTIVANKLREDVHFDIRVYLDGIGRWYDTEPSNMFIALFPMGRAMDVKKGVTCKTSSWRRITDGAIPPRIKVGSNYQNSRLAVLEAMADGYDATLLLNQNNKVSEGPGYCVFAVKKGTVITPSVASDILESITRLTLIELFEKEMKLRVEQREVDRTELYIAEEVFICGTRVEIVPIVSLDGISVGNGKPGSLTKSIQKTYFDIVRGDNKKYSHWLTPIY